MCFTRIVVCVIAAISYWSPTLFAQDRPWPVPYRNGRLWGYADPKTGEILVRPTIDSVGLFQFEDGSLNPLALIKNKGQYGLINRLGEIVIPAKQPEPLLIAKVYPGFFAVEKYSAEGNDQSDQIGAEADYLSRPIAFFNAEGRPLGQLFAYETHIDIYGEGGYWDDPNGFDAGPDSTQRLGSVYQPIWKEDKMGLFDLGKAGVTVKPEWSSIYVLGELAIAQNLQRGNPGDATSNQTTLIHLATGKKVQIPDSVTLDFYQGAGHLILAKNNRTQRYGFLNGSGKAVIPFQFKEANPFSANKLTKVLSMNGNWSVIDTSGKEIVRLGKTSSMFIGKNNEIWLPSEKDQLFRRFPVQASDWLGQTGFAYPPVQVRLDEREYWYATKAGKSGLLHTDGQVALPFEFDRFSFEFPTDLQPQDSIVWKQFFSAIKNGRSWLFERKNLEPLHPKLLPGQGLSLDKTFDQSNFDLLQPLSGDSLFVIRTASGEADILNIKTGKRWDVPNTRSFYFLPKENTGELLVYCYPINGELPTRRFDLSGRVVPSFSKDLGREVYGYGKLYLSHTPFDSIVVVLDSLDHVLCRIVLPPSIKRSDAYIRGNRDGRPMAFILIVDLQMPVHDSLASFDNLKIFMGNLQNIEQKQMIYSMAGQLLSPANMADIWIEDDFFIGTINLKYGAYNYLTHKQVLPFSYKQISVRQGNLSAVDFNGTERLFDKKGSLLRTYPEGYASISPFTDGLQMVAGKQSTRYVNKKLDFVDFPGVVAVRAFSEGLAAVQTADKTWKFITPSGRQAFEGAFKKTWNFHYGYTIVWTKDDRIKAIDNKGNTILDAPAGKDCCVHPIGRFTKNHFWMSDSLGTHIYNVDGHPILKNCSCLSGSVEEEAGSFCCDQKPGKLFEDGRIHWYGKPDFVIEKHQDQGTRSVLKGFKCPFEGLSDPVTGEWIVEPKLNQYVFALEDTDPFIFTTNDGSYQNRTVINKNTKEVLAVTHGDLRKIEGLGWLAFDQDEKESFLYSSDFKKKTPWNTAYSSISWKENMQLFQVYDQNYSLVGYITKNGHLLFED